MEKVFDDHLAKHSKRTRRSTRIAFSIYAGEVRLRGDDDFVTAAYSRKNVPEQHSRDRYFSALHRIYEHLARIKMLRGDSVSVCPSNGALL